MVFCVVVFGFFNHIASLHFFILYLSEGLLGSDCFSLTVLHLANLNTVLSSNLSQNILPESRSYLFLINPVIFLLQTESAWAEEYLEKKRSSHKRSASWGSNDQLKEVRNAIN